MGNRFVGPTTCDVPFPHEHHFLSYIVRFLKYSFRQAEGFPSCHSSTSRVLQCKRKLSKEYKSVSHREQWYRVRVSQPLFRSLKRLNATNPSMIPKRRAVVDAISFFVF